MYKAVVRQLFEGAGNSRLSTRAIKQRQTPNILKDDNVKFDFVASEYQTLVVKASEMLTEAWQWFEDQAINYSFTVNELFKF